MFGFSVNIMIYDCFPQLGTSVIPYFTDEKGEASSSKITEPKIFHLLDGAFLQYNFHSKLHVFPK